MTLCLDLDFHELGLSLIQDRWGQLFFIKPEEKVDEGNFMREDEGKPENQMPFFSLDNLTLVILGCVIYGYPRHVVFKPCH